METTTDTPAQLVRLASGTYAVMPCCGFAVALQGEDTATCPDCHVTARVEEQAKAA